MFIAVEGCTCAGKSTLIERLRTELGDDVTELHKQKPEELTRRWALTDYVLGYEDYFPTKGNILSDRWHFGERTYAPIYRPDTDHDGYGLLGVAGWRWVEMFLASRGALIMQLVASNDELAKRYRERGDDHVTDLQELFQVSALYEVARRDSVNVGAMYDSSGKALDDARFEHFVKSGLEEAKRREEAAYTLAKWPEWHRYTGSLTPDVLLVGDKRNVTKKYGDETQLPFMPVNGNSGDYLLSALPDMFWRSVGIVNGGEVEDLEGLWELLGSPRIVALGGNAEAALRTAEFSSSDYVTLPHPQWVNRFHHSKQVAYGKAIVRASQGERVEFWTPSAR